MPRNPVLNVMAMVLAAGVLSLAAVPVAATTPAPKPAPPVSMPALTEVLMHGGTKVALKFLDPVDTAKAASGDRIRFKVVEDVIVDGHVVIKKGAMLTGVINETGHPFPQNAGYANIGSLTVIAVDKKTVVGLTDVRVSAPLLGGNIQVQVGTAVTASTKADVTLMVP